MKRTLPIVIVLSGVSFLFPFISFGAELATTTDALNFELDIYNQWMMIFLGLFIGLIYIIWMRIRNVV